jgi:hypothetical protein
MISVRTANGHILGGRLRWRTFPIFNTSFEIVAALNLLKHHELPSLKRVPPHLRPDSRAGVDVSQAGSVAPGLTARPKDWRGPTRPDAI